MRCWVDLNVAERWEDLNLIGVPRGWKAYATHQQRYMDESHLMHQFELAQAHAMSDNIKFAVYAHNKEVERICMREGWLYIPEDWSKMDAAKAAKRAAMHSDITITDERKEPQLKTLVEWC